MHISLSLSLSFSNSCSVYTYLSICLSFSLLPPPLACLSTGNLFHLFLWLCTCVALCPLIEIVPLSFRHVIVIHHHHHHCTSIWQDYYSCCYCTGNCCCFTGTWLVITIHLFIFLRKSVLVLSLYVLCDAIIFAPFQRLQLLSPSSPLPPFPSSSLSPTFHYPQDYDHSNHTQCCVVFIIIILSS